MRGAGKMRDRLQFGPVSEVEDDNGDLTTMADWQPAVWADLIYQSGGEDVQDTALQGTATYKVRLRSTEFTRGIGHDWACRDPRRSVEYQIVEVDAVTDPAIVWLVIESGVAT